jgi:YidC/Oxa1 family membrane protein insertase
VADARVRRVEVLGDQLELAFTNEGARLISWRLRRYRDAAGRPEEMVAPPGRGPRPLDLETGIPEVDERLRTALFQVSTETLTLRGGEGGELTFRFAEGDLAAEKRLSLPGTGYLVEVSGRVRRGGADLPTRVLWGPGIGNPSEADTEVQGYLPPQAVFLSAGQVERVAADKIGASRSVVDARWLGVESQYFAALFVPRRGGGHAELRAVEQPSREGGTRRGPVAVVDVAPAADGVWLYVGPKDHPTLAAVGHGLDKVVPVGDWIGPLVIGLMKLLRLVQERVGSYGWSIVLLTVLINLAMSPLRHYGIATGAKMAKLGPEMRAIQERYRRVPMLDPKRQEMQQEMAALYARHGMSMSTQMTVGCLPMLLTLPFLFAFYRMLSTSIDLRGAPFLWIPDLSHKDPLFLTPILMGASMFIMQRMTPSTMDPAQQRIMLLMPLVMSAMFLWAPAGLNLYWFVANLCSIVQQAVTLRLLRRQEAPAARREKRRG